MKSWPAPQIPALPGQAPPLALHDASAAGGAGIAAPPAPGAAAGMYVCGITPYDATHLGHAATYVAFDLLLRTWRDGGHAVRYVQNVTDVDDPLLERARQTGQDWTELAESETALFREDMTALGVVPPDAFIGAVEAMPLVVDAVRDLLAAGAAYRVAGTDGEPDGDVYFAIAATDTFGEVSGLDRGTMLALFGERGGDPDRPGKKDPLDPLLWRVERPGEPSWDGGDLGRGRPGWHIECTVIAREHLGTPFEVQGGGSDLIFPHHEMSAAHGRVLDGGAPFARACAHAGMVGWQGAKMSKSRGNLVLVSALRQAGHDPAAIRLALLDHHYRTDWEWTDADLERATTRLARWRDAVSRDGGVDADEVVTQVRAAMAADLDAPAALRAVDAWVQTQLDGGQGHGHGHTEGAPGVVSRTVDALLGIRL